MNLRLLVALFLVSGGVCRDAWAWGDQGHKVICEIAMRLVQPNTRPCDQPAGKVTIDAAYVVANAPIVREQLQKAGVRLALLLDAALGR
jgi:hypothetical protein